MVSGPEDAVGRATPLRGRVAAPRASSTSRVLGCVWIVAKVHLTKKMATIQTKTNLWVMTKILVRCTLATIQTHPNTRLVEDARGTVTRPWSGVARPTASPGPETMPGRLAF